MEVEREPLDLGAVPALEPRRALGRDVAEGSYVVRPDSDQRRHADGVLPGNPRSRCRLTRPCEWRCRMRSCSCGAIRQPDASALERVARGRLSVLADFST